MRSRVDRGYPHWPRRRMQWYLRCRVLLEGDVRLAWLPEGRHAREAGRRGREELTGWRWVEERRAGSRAVGWARRKAKRVCGSVDRMGSRNGRSRMKCAATRRCRPSGCGWRPTCVCFPTSAAKVSAVQCGPADSRRRAQPEQWLQACAEAALVGLTKG